MSAQDLIYSHCRRVGVRPSRTGASHNRQFMRGFVFGLVFAGLAAGLVSCARPNPERVSFTAENLFPEGVVYDARRGRFLVSSLRKGVIGAVNDAGVYTPLIQDERIVSAIGLHIDAERDRLIVCVSDPGVSVRTAPATQKKIAGLGVYSLADGKNLFFGNLAAEDAAGEHFANDSTVDAAGNIYVTNSFSPVIYKVTPDYQVSEFLRDRRFAGGGFRLNGVDIFGDALIVANSGDGKLYRIPLEKPDELTEIEMEKPLLSADGVTKIGPNELVVVTNTAFEGEPMAAHFLRTEDGWVSAKIVKSVKKDWQFPTTAALRDGDVYVLSAKLSILFSGSGETVRNFEIYNVSK